MFPCGFEEWTENTEERMSAGKKNVHSVFEQTFDLRSKKPFVIVQPANILNDLEHLALI